MYPDRYRLPEVTAHVLSLLERRLPGFTAFDDAAASELEAEAKRALEEAGRQFREIADDPAYWKRLERSVLEVALPRWLILAKDHHRDLRNHFGVWRRGDLVARLAYAGVGLVGAGVVALTRIPDWLEPLPLFFLLGGPFLPDLQEWWGRRGHRKRLAALIDDMRAEQEQLETYQPLAEVRAGGLEAIQEAPASEGTTPVRQKERT